MLISKSDRKGQIAAFFYDSLGRNTEVKNYLFVEDQEKNIVHSQVRTAYDKRGNAVRIDNDNLIEYYQYDFGNRVTSLKRTLKDYLTDIKTSVAGVWGGTPADQVFSFSYEYNDGGLVQKMIYPDGSEHSYAYDNYLARLQGISEKAVTDLNPNPFVTSLNYTNSGVVTDMSYTNGVTQYWKFDNRKRIKNLSIVHTDNTDIQNPVVTTLEDLNYSLNKNGDILSINENEYTYDGFNRIIGAKTLLPESKGDVLKLVKESFGSYANNPTEFEGITLPEYNADADLKENETDPAGDGRINGLDLIRATLKDINSDYDIESFQYDKNGNRTRLEQNGDVYTYKYGERNRLLSVSLQKKGENLPKKFISYTYDDNGNLIKRDIVRSKETETILFIYDTLNRLIETQEQGKSTKYFYDNAGNRFIKQGHDGETTLYLRHGQIVVAMDIEIPGSTKVFKEGEEYKGKIIRYVMSGDLTAGKITRTVKPDSTEIIAKSFYHLDHLNSTKMVTDETGAIEANYTYRAFCEQLNALQEKDAKYTYGGKELDSNTNLYYFNARFYDATIGRFINVDPIQDGSNWYVYCSNNPLNRVDPTGLDDDNYLVWYDVRVEGEAYLYSSMRYSYHMSATFFGSSVKEAPTIRADNYCIHVNSTDRIRTHEHLLYIPEGSSAKVIIRGEFKHLYSTTLESGYHDLELYRLKFDTQQYIRMMDSLGKELKYDKEFQNKMNICYGIFSVGLDVLSTGSYTAVTELAMGYASMLNDTRGLAETIYDFLFPSYAEEEMSKISRQFINEYGDQYSSRATAVEEGRLFREYKDFFDYIEGGD